MQNYTQQKIEALGFLLIDEKMYLASHCHVKKIAVKFEKKIPFFYFFLFVNCVFFYTKKLKIYEDSYLKSFKD